MCLILIAIDRVPGQRLTLLGNRDEFHQRASAAAMPWPGHQDVLGGRDLVAGGSWLAVRNDGRFAVVTNLRTGVPATAPASRGWLVRDFVTGDDEPSDYLDRLVDRADEYGPFNLVVGAGDSVHAYDGSTRRRQPLEAGVHAVSNGALTARWPKTQRLHQLFGDTLAARGDDRHALLASLRDEQPAADEALPDTGVGLERERMLAPVFIRGNRYGTRASSLLTIADDGALAFDEIRYGPDAADGGRSSWRSSGDHAEWRGGVSA